MDKSNTNESIESSKHFMEDSATLSEESYHSSELLLEVIQREFEYEADRVKSLETRTGIFLAFSGALLVFITSSLKIPNLKTVEVNSLYQAFLPIIVIVLTILAMLLLIISSIIFVKVISLQTYKRLAFNGFTKNNAKELKSIIAVELMMDYQKIVTHNNEVNNKKINMYKYGILTINAAIIMTAIIFCLNIFL